MGELFIDGIPGKTICCAGQGYMWQKDRCKNTPGRPYSIMAKLYSYILRYDNGTAPNPFWDICTLTICKPAIRKAAQVGDWVIGTGSKHSRLRKELTVDLSESIVYAMKVTCVKTLKEYDRFCLQHLQQKIPSINTSDWRMQMGDCVYDFSHGGEPLLRQNVHNEINRKRDFDGRNALLSEQFYYFGEEARPLPHDLKPMIKKNRGHQVITQEHLILQFEEWIEQYHLNTIYAKPQLLWEFPASATDRTM